MAATNSPMKCPECGSEEIVSHTDEKCRAEHTLVWQCWACNTFWCTDDGTGLSELAGVAVE